MEGAKREGRELRERKDSRGPSKTDCVGLKGNSMGVKMFCTTAGIPSKALQAGEHSASAYILQMTGSSILYKAAYTSLNQLTGS